MSNTNEQTPSQRAGELLAELTAQNIFDLRGVVAVVTGGGTGIGLMISSTLMANGATVYIIGPDQAKLDSIAETYNKAASNSPGRGKLVGIQADIRIKEEALRIAKELEKREGHVTVLFNNAGILNGHCGPIPASSTTDQAKAKPSAETFFNHLWKLNPDTFDDHLRTNAFSAYWLSVAFLPLLEKWGGEGPGLDSSPTTISARKRFAPQIVMTSSMNGWTKDSATAAYSFPYLMSKSAIGHFTSTLAHELIPLGIRVNGIAPGLFVTEMSAPGTIDEVGVSHWKREGSLSFEVPATRPPAGGFGSGGIGGSPRDMGTLALFLVANWYVNGETVLIDGGTLLKHPSSY